MANNDEQVKAFYAFLDKFMQQSGAGGLMGFDQPQGQQGPFNPMNAGQAVSNPGVFANPVGGNLAPSYGPQGVIFPGGSPFPVDPGPAKLQNTMVGLRDLLASPIGQQALAALKKKLG